MTFKRIYLFIFFIFLLNCSSNSERANRSEMSNQDSVDIMYINAMEMFNENSGVVSAVCEQITMNVDLTLRKSNKYPDWVREKFDLMIKSQKGKPLPSQIGKSLALKS